MCVAAICSVSGQTCNCTIGRNDDSELNEGTDQRFYLDVNNPATCNGTITNWTVCYYGRSDSGSYWATYAVYQRMGSGDDEYYERVSEMFTAVTSTMDVGFSDGLNQMGFNCYTDFIDIGNSPLTIQAGDIIGACVFNPSGGPRRELDIVGEVSGESLMQADIDCTMDAMLSSIQQSELQPCDDRRLHIYANIEPGKMHELRSVMHT